MHGHDTTNEAVGARDQRPPSLGLGRIIIALFWLLGAWILVTAILDLFHAQGQPWGPRIVALLAGIDYLVAATALTLYRVNHRPDLDVALESAQDRLTRRAGRTSVRPLEGALTHCLIQR